jgi:hypothetical protein
MKTIFEHIEYVRGKPHHIRQRVALASAAAGAGLIALVWLAASLSTGAFAIGGSSFADAGGTPAVTTVSGTSALAGVAGAAEESGPARIEIIDTTAAPVKTPEPTTVPF